MTIRPSHRRRLAALTAFVSALAIGAPAHAQNPAPNHWDSFSCSNGRAVIAQASYYLTSTQHQWGHIAAQAQGSGLGSQNNFFDYVYVNGSQVFNWQSPDNIPPNTWWIDTSPGGVNLRTARSATEVVKVRGVFDIFGPDSSCTAQKSY